MECQVCGRSARDACNGCGVFFYCGRKHQTQHWQLIHQDECHRLRLQRQRAAVRAVPCRSASRTVPKACGLSPPGRVAGSIQPPLRLRRSKQARRQQQQRTVSATGGAGGPSRGALEARVQMRRSRHSSMGGLGTQSTAFKQRADRFRTASGAQLVPWRPSLVAIT